MSKISNKSKNRELRSFGDHHKFLSRIKKTLYYGKLPTTDTLSLPVTELASELFSEPRRANRSLERLHCKDAASISRKACISPCSLVLAMLYLDRLKARNPDYLHDAIPSELFLVSLMVSCKFLHDFGEDDEVFADEWATSGGVTVRELIDLEREFLRAIEWDVFVSEPHFWTKLRCVELTLAQKEGYNRGFYTYTELERLFSLIDARNLIHSLATILAVITVAYTMGILTIASAVFVANNLTNLKLSENEQIHLAADINNHVSTQQNNYNINAVDVLQTSIILASIKSTNPNVKTLLDINDTSTNYVKWDWWSNPIMLWLAETSKTIETYTCTRDIKPNTQHRYQEMSLVTYRWLELQDQVHKSTKIRIQDQLERTWHAEWTDSVCNMLVGLGYAPIEANFRGKKRFELIHE